MKHMKRQGYTLIEVVLVLGFAGFATLVSLAIWCVVNLVHT